ncbi:hypothetical protein Tco_0343321 [Tanacetum coccineum]
MFYRFYQVRLRIEQYFQVQDYALWDIIENGNSFKPVSQTTTNADGSTTSLIPGPVTTEEKVQKKNDVKARSMLLMALPNEHLMIFNQYKDAKTMFAAIQTRFGGNEATKKTQKTLLKQMRNKPDLDTMSFDNLYNNIKIVEQVVKRTASSSSQNMDFVSSPSSTNEVNTAYRVSTTNTQVSPASTQVSIASTQVSTANATVYAFLANQLNGSQLVHEDLEQIHEDNLEDIDLKWQLALLSMRTKMNQDNSRRTVNVEETSSKAMVAIDEACFDWSYMVDDEVPTNMALMAYSDSEVDKLKQEKESNQLKIENFDNASKRLISPLNLDLSYSGLEEFQQPELKGYEPKTSNSDDEDISNGVRESPDAPLVEELVSDDKPKAVNTARPNTSVVNVVRANQDFDEICYFGGKEPKRGKILVKELFKLRIGSGVSQCQRTPYRGQTSSTLGKRESLETNLKQAKKIYGAAYTRLIKKGRRIAENDQDPSISLVQHDVEIQGRYEHDRSCFEIDAAKNFYCEKISSSFNVEEWEDIQARVQADEELVQRLQAEEKEKYTKADQERMLTELINQRKRYFAVQRAEERRNKPPIQAQQRTYMSNYIKHMGGYTLQQLRGYSFDEIKTLFETTMRSTGESSKLSEEPRDKEADELSQEELQQMMIIVPDQGMNVEALQTKYPIIDWEIYTKGTRKYWKIIRVGNHTEVHQFFDDMLKAFDMDDLVMLWNLVKEKFNSTKPTDEKEREIWVELKRLFKPNTDDELWKLQKHIHYLTWKLYDSCGVHHVSMEKGIDIYMLVEKENPLSRGTLTLMLVVAEASWWIQDNEIPEELLRKKFQQVERPKR